MEIRPIRTDKDHKAALAEIEAEFWLNLQKLYELRLAIAPWRKLYRPNRAAAFFWQMHGWPRQFVRAGWRRHCSPAVTHRRVSQS